MNGVHCQVSPMSTTMRAVHGSDAQANSLSPSPVQMSAKGPLCMSASMRNM